MRGERCNKNIDTEVIIPSACPGGSVRKLSVPRMKIGVVVY